VRTCICGSLLILLLCGNLFAADYSIQKVEIAPLSSGISFNSVTTLYKDWITAPSVELVGRKEILILNTSTSENLYLTGVSGSSATGIVYPRESATFKAASNLHIYASGNSVLFQTWEIR
jgi:hypothetical protein